MAVNNPVSELSQEIIAPLFVLKPEHWPSLIARYGAEFMTPNGYLWFKTISEEHPIASTTFYWFEKNRYNETITVLNPVASPGAGNPISFTLAPTSVDTGNLYHVQEQNTIMFTNEVVGNVINIDRTIPSAPVITVEPLEQTDTIPALSANDQLIIITNANSDASNQPQGLVPKVERFENTNQIIKHTFSADGTVMTDQTWISANGNPYTLLLDKQFNYNMAVSWDGAMMFGKTNTNNVASSDNGRNVRSTTGMIPSVRQRGYTIPITPGGFTLFTLDEYDLILTREGASSMACYQMGLSLAQEVNMTIFTSYKDTNLSAASSIKSMAFGVNNETAEAIATLMNVKEHRTISRSWMFKTMDSWIDPGMYGAAGYKFINTGLIYPLGKTQTVFKEEDSTSGTKVPNLHSCYKMLGDYNRKLKLWTIGGAKGVLSQQDLDSTYGRMDIAFRGLGLNQVIYTPSVS